MNEKFIFILGLHIFYFQRLLTDSMDLLVPQQPKNLALECSWFWIWNLVTTDFSSFLLDSFICFHLIYLYIKTLKTYLLKGGKLLELF